MDTFHSVPEPFSGIPPELRGTPASVTGHRPEAIDGDWTCTSPAWQRISGWFSEQIDLWRPTCVIVGMALGVDQLAAQAAIDARVPFVAAVPFEGQERRWPERSQRRFHELLALAAATVFVNDGGYAAWKMHARNQWMIDSSANLWAVWNGTPPPGGTASCVLSGVSSGAVLSVFDPVVVNPPLDGSR